MAVKKLRKIILGQEVTAGTAVVCSTIWHGTGTMEDKLDTVFPEEDVGLLMGTDRAYIASKSAGLTVEGDATYEQLVHILAAGIKTVAGSQDGTGSGYIYIYPFPTNAANTGKTYTIEFGDDQQAEEMEYAFVEKFTLSGKAKEAVMVSADWSGRQVSLCSFTGTATLPTVSTILFQNSYLFIDAIGSSAGTTTKSNTLLAFDLSVTTGFTPVFAADGSLYFSFVKQVMPEVELKVTFEHDATSVAEKAAWRAGTPRIIRLKTVGPAVTTNGSTYQNKTLIIDLCGKWSKFEKIAEQNGNDIVTGTFKAAYDATAAQAGQVIVVNELATIP